MFMFFSRKYSNLVNFRKFIYCAVFSLFISLVAFASQSYATNVDYQKGSVTISASICKQTTISGRSYVYMDCSREIDIETSSSFENPTQPQQYFKFTGSSMGDLISSYNSTYSCYNSGVRCFLKISRIVYTPKDNSGTPVYLSDGDYYLFRFSSTHGIYLGTDREFHSDTVEDQLYNFGGLDSYLNFNFQDQYSCLDNTGNPCSVSYRFYHDRDNLDLEGNYHSLITSGKVSSTLAYNYEFINNVYNSTFQTYDRNPYTGLLYYIELTNKNTFNSTGYKVFDGYIYFSKTDEYVDVNSDGGGVNPDDLPEWNIIQDVSNEANDSNSQLGGISIPIFNPISSWLVLFTDNECIDISVIPGWFGASSQHICSPWNSTIKGFITPVISVAGTMLLFGYAVRWLNGSSYYKGDVDG